MQLLHMWQFTIALRPECALYCLNILLCVAGIRLEANHSEGSVMADVQHALTVYLEYSGVLS